MFTIGDSSSGTGGRRSTFSTSLKSPKPSVASTISCAPRALTSSRLDIVLSSTCDFVAITTTVGWGIETYYNQGQFNNHDGGNQNDLLIINGAPDPSIGVAGVSENITIQPSAAEAGQVYDFNPTTGTSIAVVNYVNNTNLKRDALMKAVDGQPWDPSVKALTQSRQGSTRWPRIWLGLRIGRCSLQPAGRVT